MLFAPQCVMGVLKIDHDFRSNYQL